MKFKKGIESLGINVIDAGFSIPPNEKKEVMYLRYITIDDLDKYYYVNKVNHDSATILERVVESIFETNEDLNGDIIVDGHHYIVRLMNDEYYKDVNDPRIYLSTRRLSIIEEEDKNVICSELDSSISALDERLTRDVISMIYLKKE